MTARRPTVPAFTAWTIAGAGLCLGVLTGFGFGILVLPAALLLVAVLLVRQGTRNDSALGLVSGAGLVLLYVAYLDRHGPGTVCTQTPTERSCTEMWNPWPWLVAGLMLSAIGIVVYYMRLHRDSRISDRCRVSPGVV